MYKPIKKKGFKQNNIKAAPFPISVPSQGMDAHPQGHKLISS